MSMTPDDDRNAAQIKADDELYASIEKVISAYGMAPPGTLYLSSYMIVGNGFVSGDDGEHRVYYKVLKDGGIDLNFDECQGMLHRAGRELDAEYFERGEKF